jgi:hypothetical protein
MDVFQINVYLTHQHHLHLVLLIPNSRDIMMSELIKIIQHHNANN